MDRKFVSLIFFAIFLPQELMLSESEDRCCVDEVAAQHVDADFIVHYGHTCLSPQVFSPLQSSLFPHPVLKPLLNNLVPHDFQYSTS